jgi:predicted dehydrogenase
VILETNQEACRVAIIGAGDMAREHLRAFQDVPGVDVAGLCSRTRSRADALAATHGVAIVCDSVPELYERTRADLVVIAVNVIELAAVTRACFEFPWTVLVEKPVGYNFVEAEEVRQAAASKRRKVLVALNRRFLSSTRAALADLRQVESPRYIHVQDQESLDQAAALMYPRVIIENWMYANSIHVIDYLRTFGRGPVTSVTPIIPWNPDSPGVVLAKIQFESGDVGLYEGIWDGPGPWAAAITTSEKRWEMRPLEQAAFQARGERALQMIETSRWDQDFKPGFRLQAEMAVAAAKGRPSEAPTLDEAIETIKIIKDIFS